MAQQVVTELVIDSSKAVAGANDYARAMDGAQSAMQRNLGAMSDGVSQMRDNIAGLTIGVTAAAGVFLALSAAAKEFASSLADMGSAAKRAGLDVESFQKLQFAASLEGLSNKDFSSGVEKMAARLNDASRNENELSKLLDANNVKFKDANGTLISTTALLEKARDLISRAANEQDKIKMAEMLGLTKQWVPLLDKSAQAFADVQNEAKALGLVIDDSAIKKAADFDREWRKSSTVFTTWVKSQLAELFPLLDELIAKARDFAANLKDSLDAAANSPAGQDFSARSARSAAILDMLSENNTVKENADIVVAAGKAMAGTLSATTAALIDEQIAGAKTAKMWNDIASGWENAAAAGARLNQNVPMPRPRPGAANDNVSVVPATDVTETKDALDRAIESIKRHTEVTLADADAQGLGAQALAEYRAIANLVTAAERAGIDVTGKLGEKFADLATKAGEATLALEKAKIASQLEFQGKTLFLNPEDLKIAQALQHIYGNDIPAALASSEAATMRLQATQKKMFDGAKADAQAFLGSLAQGLLQNKSLAESLSSAFNNLAQMAANAGIKNLLEGNFAMAAVDAAVAIGSKIAGGFFDDSAKKALEQAKQQWVGMTEKLQIFEATAKGFDLSGPAAALRSLFDSALDLAKAANAAHDMPGLLRVVQGFAAGMARIVTDFANPPIGLSDSANKIKTLNDQAAGLIQTLADIGQSSQGASDAINSGLIKQIQAIKDDLSKSLTADINDASGKGFINSVNDLLAKQQQLLTENNAPAALINNWFQAELQKVADGLNSDEFQAFASTFPDLAKNIHSATTEIKSLQDQLNKTAASIVNYINNLVGGPNSTLSPTATLSNAQAAYNANYNLASLGNLDAQNKFVSLADNLEKAARAVYASGQGYQDIRSQIISQGLALPAVQATTDPVVAALATQLTAINSIKDASETSALNSWSVRANTGGTQDAAFQTRDNAGTTAANAATTASNVDSLDNPGSKIFNMEDYTRRVVNAINNHGAMTVAGFNNLSVHLANIRSTNLYTAAHAQGAANLGVAESVVGAAGGFTYTPAAAGGVIPAHGLGLVSEHLNPTFLRAGPEPIHVFPGAPSNDNSALLAEVKRLNDKIDRLERVVAGSGASVERAVRETSDDEVGALDESGRRVSHAIRTAARDNKAAA